MKRIWFAGLLTALLTVAFSGGIFAQNNAVQPTGSRDVSEEDGIPILTKHLPDWENARNRASYILNKSDLQNALGAQKVFDALDFANGTEAVTAPYAEGKLLLVEFQTPQSSIDADARINQILAETGENQSIVYRRIGNYNVLVFDAADPTAANALLDQVKYEKTVQWLGEDPFLLKRAERAMVKGLSEMFVFTIVAIMGVIGIAVLLGIVVGFVYFRYSDKRRATMETFSDAGGMTRLNLDGFTPEIAADRLFPK